MSKACTVTTGPKISTAFAAEEREARVAALLERVRSTADAETTVTATDDVNDVGPPI